MRRQVIRMSGIVVAAIQHFLRKCWMTHSNPPGFLSNITLYYAIIIHFLTLK